MLGQKLWAQGHELYCNYYFQIIKKIFNLFFFFN